MYVSSKPKSGRPAGPPKPHVKGLGAYARRSNKEKDADYGERVIPTPREEFDIRKTVEWLKMNSAGDPVFLIPPELARYIRR